MATYDQPHHQLQTHTRHHRFDPSGAGAGDRPYYAQEGQSKSKALAVMTLLPVGGVLLGLAGITLVGTMIGLAVAAPLFVIFSPVLVPAVLTIGLAVTGFLTSGTLGLTGLSSLSYMVNVLRQVAGTVPEQIDYAKDRLQDLAVYTGQKTKEVGQTIQNKAHDIGPERQTGQGTVHVQAGGKEGGKAGDRT